MKLIPTNKEDLLNEIGKRRRIIRVTVESDKCFSVELSKISIGGIIEEMETSKSNDFYFIVDDSEEVSVDVR